MRAPDRAPRQLPTALREALAGIAWTDERVADFARRLPKVETHLHLDGAVAPETLLALAREIPGPSAGAAALASLELEEIRRRVVVEAPRENLAAVLAAFGDVLPLLRTPEALERVACELLHAAAREAILHAEVRFAPALHVTPDLDQEAVLRAVLAGLERGRRETGVSSGVIVCLIRPPAYVSWEANRAMLELALAYRGRGVVALDLAGDEASAPLAEYAELFRRARRGGLHLVAHAGEVAGSPDLATALELGVERIGHGVALEQAPELLAEVIRRGIAIEVNLTSNFRTGSVASLARHPVRHWFAAGARIALSTDDPAIFGIDLTGEYLLLHRELAFTPAELAEVALQGIDALFLPEEKGNALCGELEFELSAFLEASTT